MELLIIFGIVIAGAPILACTLMHLLRIHIYRKVYRNLKEEDFYIYDTAFGKWVTDKNLNTIYFEDGDIKVHKGVYLFNSFSLTYMSPVGAYWYNKFKKFFNKIKENNEEIK